MYAWLVEHQLDENGRPLGLGATGDFDQMLVEPIAGLTREDDPSRAEEEGASFMAALGKMGG